MIPDAEILLLNAVRAAPRRYLMPPLPASCAAARAQGTEVALAFAIEAARVGKERGTAPSREVEDLFTSALADLVRAALVPAGGDPAFQALLLHGRDAQVREYVRLAAQGAADRREVRGIVDAIAHPGKLRAFVPGPLRATLEQLHAQAKAQAWSALRATASQEAATGDAGVQATLATLRASPALARLERTVALLQSDAVQRHQALCRRRGPPAGSDVAAAHGRASAQLGEQAEAATMVAFATIAARLDRAAGAPCHRVVQGLRLPRGFPGSGGKAKQEWDAAIVCGDAVAQLVLLAEVKASPAAATSDLPRLLRGLDRLAQADAAASHAFPCAGGEVRIAGASLRRLQPHARALPPQVIYCCTAPPERAPAALAAASKAVLLAAPATLAFAGALADGGAPPPAALAPVWQALTTAPGLRATLHQYETARTVRSAMLQPQDLVAALAANLAR